MPALGKQLLLAVPRLSSPLCAMTRFRRGSGLRFAVRCLPSLALTLPTAPIATFLQRPPRACPLLPNDRQPSRSITAIVSQVRRL